MLYSAVTLVALSLVSAATAGTTSFGGSQSNNHRLSKRNNNNKHNDHKKQCDDKPKKPYVSSGILVSQMYESDLEDGAYILQGIADRYNG
jgi:hypothetical protein